MSAYVIAALNVSDPEGYQVYKEMVPPTIADHGGTYLARGGRFEVLEGDSDLNRIVLLKFESFEQAKAWWNSSEYEAAKPHRQRCATSNILLVEGPS